MRRPRAMDAWRLVRDDVRRGLPYAVVLAIALGVVLVVGAHLSNAFPSASRPFGWEGPAHFDNAVAMVRGDLVLASTLPALAMGALALRHREPTIEGPARILRTAGVHGAMITLAAFVAGAIGAWGAFRAPLDSYLAFSTAHALLALAFYALALLSAALLRAYAMAGALGAWLFFNAFYEGAVRLALFRQMGYHRLAAGEFPPWFFVAQALSPLSAYRGTLILWRRGFMDYLEKAALGNAILPPWLNPLTLGSLLFVLWVALPVGLACGVWWWRGKDARALSLWKLRRDPE